MKFKRSILLFTFICLLAGFSISQADDKIVSDTLKSLAAFRTDSEIKIDGYLNEPVWQQAETASGFRQSEPDNGHAATENTVVKVLYSDEAIYVGFWCSDTEPDKIIKQLTRRDRYTDADNVTVRFDSYHDHQSAHYFNLNASGVKQDILFFNNNNADDSWDAVWDGNVQMNANGWTAEFKIPYTALRFIEKDVHTWGLDFTRQIARNDEFVRWQFVAESETGGVSRYGHLTGLKGITAPARIETLPYFVSYGTKAPKTAGNPDGLTSFSNIGGEFKYSLSSSFTLDATINPDFGQVEFDGANVNLGTFEQWYPERRPFFLEGMDIFNLPYFDQFYSRRIGGAPGGHNVKDVNYTLDYPTNTTILGALKLSGRTESGMSIGILNATTQEETMTYRKQGDSINSYEAVVEPRANYTVARVKQEIGNSSYVGGMITSSIQAGLENAYTASADWKIFSPTKQYSFTGMAIRNQSGPGTSGGAYFIDITKETGKFHRGNVMADYYDANYDLNRLGLSRSNNFWGMSTWQQLYYSKRFGILKRVSINFNGYYNQLNNGMRFTNGGNINGNFNFVNNWGAGYGIGYSGSRYDHNETRDNGLWKRPAGYDLWYNIYTNSAKQVQFEYYGSRGSGLDGKDFDHNFWLNFKPITQLEFSIGTGYQSAKNRLLWAGTINDTTQAAINGLPVFGRIDRETASINTRGLYSFNRDLTLQWAAEFYLSAGEMDEFQVLTDPETLEDMPAETNVHERSDIRFNLKSLQANVVLRWEFRPGSSLFAVWSHNRNEYLTDYGDFNLNRDMKSLFSTPQTNSLALKVNYWWNL